MDSNRKRRGSSFIKGKLVMSFYRTPPPATKPTTSMQYSTNKVKPSPPPSSTTSVGYQEFLVPPASKKIAFVKADDNIGGDESVDMKAASYISYVQERFRLERMASERRNYKDVSC